MSRERGKRMRRGEISILVKREQQQQHVFFFFWKRFWTSVWIEKERERERDDFCLERKERNFFKIKDKRDMNHEIPRGLSPTITWPPRQWHNGPTDRPTGDIPADGFLNASLSTLARQFSTRKFSRRWFSTMGSGTTTPMDANIYREIK